MTTYELEREQRMLDNAARLHSLKLNDSVQLYAAAAATSFASRARRKRSCADPAVASQHARMTRSARNALGATR